MSMYKSLKRLLQLEPPPNLFYCIRRKSNGEIYEVYNIFRKKDHKSERIYTLKETYEILKDYKSLKN